MRLDTQIYMQQCLASSVVTEQGNDEIVFTIVDSILEKYRYISNKGLFKKQNIDQNELFILSLEENNKLLEWINERFALLKISRFSDIV
jgi:hypothetical protein